VQEINQHVRQLVVRSILQVVPETNGTAEFVGIHPYVEGSITQAHTSDVWSGIPSRFASQADHSHRKFRISSVTAGSAAERAQQIYSAYASGVSILNLHGYESEVAGTTVANEDSIDTTATTAGGSSPFAGTIKLRYNVSPTLSLNEAVIFRVTSAVAGIQASFFAGTITQAPTLVSGKFEVLVQINGLDSNHWDPTKAANTALQNGDWLLIKVTAGEINAANKTSLMRDSSGPSDQLIATWATAHGLAYGDNVILYSDGTVNGLSGIFLGFVSGVVVDVPNDNTARIRFRNLRNESLRSYSGTASNTNWRIFRGTLDPHHEIIQSGNMLTGRRDSNGLLRRLMLGDTDVVRDDELALGVGGEYNTLRLYRGDLSVGGISLASRRAAMEGGIRFFGDLGANTQAYFRMTGNMGIGLGDYSVFIRARFGPVLPSFGLNPAAVLFSFIGNDGSPMQNYSGVAIFGNGQITIDGSAEGNTANQTTTYNNVGSELMGRVADIVLVRSSGRFIFYVNGRQMRVNTGEMTSDRAQFNWGSATEVRIGGYFIREQNFNSDIYAFAVYNAFAG
jgi:hypothetical protein